MQNFKPPEERQQPYPKGQHLKSPKKLTPGQISQFSASNSGIPRHKDTQKRTTERDQKNPNDAIRHPSHRSPPGQLGRAKSHTNEDLSNLIESDPLENRAEARKVIQNAKLTLLPRNELETDISKSAKDVTIDTSKTKTAGTDESKKSAKTDSSPGNKQSGARPNEGNINPNNNIKNGKSIEYVPGFEPVDDLRDNDGNESVDMNTDEVTVADENTEGQNEPFTVVFEFDCADKDILKCPLDINQAIRAAGIPPETTSDVVINLNRNLLALKTHSKEAAEKWLKIKSIGGKNVRSRWAKETPMSSFGVIGPITCPTMKDEMERKKLMYIQAIKEGGTEVLSIECLKKREKRNEEWKTEMTRSLKLEFVGEPPRHVYIGPVSYEVGEYTPEVIQCFNCQNFGHIGKHCHATHPVCVFCGVKGHRVKEKKCRTRRPRCYNCRGEHTASYRGCPAYKREKLAQTIKVDQKKNIHEARKITDTYINQFPPVNPRETTDDRRQPIPETPTHQGRAWSQVAAHHLKRKPPPIEGNRWELPTRLPETPTLYPESKPQRTPKRRTSERRERRPTMESLANDEGYNLVTPQDLINDIRGVVQESIKEILTKVLTGFASLIVTTVYAHSVSEEGKKELIKNGIEELCTEITESLNPQVWQQQKKRTRYDNNQDKEASHQEMDQEESHSVEGAPTGAFTYRNIPGLYDSDTNDNWNQNKGGSGWRRNR